MTAIRHAGAAALMQAVLALAPTEPSDLQPSTVPVPSVARGQVLVEVRAAAVHRSDVLSSRGVLPGPFPRVLGRDYAGLVVDGTPEWMDQRVWGTRSADTDATLGGTHAQFILVETSAVARTPQLLTDIEAGASALAYFTAATAIARAGGHGAALVVSGAAGAVGGAAASIGAWRGAKVIGIVRAEADVARALGRGCSVVIVSDHEDVAERILEETDGAGASAAVDAVGGALTAVLLRGMAFDGGICVIAAPPASSSADIDILDFYRKQLRLSGLNIGRSTGSMSALTLAELAPGFDSGALRPVAIAGEYALADASAAYSAAFAAGRPVLVP